MCFLGSWFLFVIVFEMLVVLDKRFVYYVLRKSRFIVKIFVV